MQFLFLTRRRTEQFPPEHWTPALLEQEAQQVRTLFSDGVLRAIWRRQDIPGAAILFEAEKLADALAAANSLPLAKLGMLEFTVMTGLEPYPGFGPR